MRDVQNIHVCEHLICIHLFCVLQKHVEEESNEFSDIIIEDFVDTYNNLTIKTLMLLKWVKNNCNSTGYVMKTDDDVYINVKNLAVFVNRIPEADSQDILCGRLICSARPISDPTSKW
jgi:beta-1,3-galactosyltransferase 1